MMYWFGHLPSTTGCGPDVVENNWWSYFLDPSLALFPSLNCPAVPPAPILPGNTVRVSLNSAGGQTLADSLSPSMSADGHYVAFQSAAANLVAGDTNGVDDIFLRDLQTGTIRRVSVSSSGVQGDGYSMDPAVSADGRYVAFYSFSTNLVPGDTNGTYDIFVHDIQTGLTTRISLDSNEVQANGLSHFPSISADGRYVAFFSAATNLVSGDTNGMNDIFVRDLQNGTTLRASVSSTGAQGNNFSSGPAISADGRYVAFYSYASNLVSGDTNGRVDIFVRDLQSGVTTRASVDSSGLQSNNDSFNPSLSADGHYIAFESNATNLVSGDTNTRNDIFVHDLQTRITTRVSVSSSGTQGNNFSVSASISGDGRYVAYYSGATNLVSGDTNGWDDTFVRDIQTGTTARVSVSSTGAQANNSSGSPFLSADGQTILFRAYATNLVPSDTNGMPDIFLHRLNTPLPPASTSTFTPVATKTTTPTPTKTNTPTITSTSGPVSNNPLYISLANSQTIGSVAAADEDILKFDGSNWSLFFDGSDVGVGSPDLFAFSIVDADTLLLSFNSAVTVNGIAATPQDILRFDATSLGSTTSGTWSMYFDGSDAGLEDATTEKIDSLSLLPGGRLLISTTGNPVVSGVSSAKDEDALAFIPTAVGAVTSGTWAMFFDGSDVGLAETSGEDVDALAVVGSTIYLSTQDFFSVNGVSGADEDIFVCASITTGDVTACNYSPTLYFDGSTWGLDANDVDALSLITTGTPPTITPPNTPTRTPTGTVGAPNTPTRTPTVIAAPNTPTRTPTLTAGVPNTPTRTPTRTATPTQLTSQTVTFAPAADAYVYADNPITNYGSLTVLRADGSPD